MIRASPHSSIVVIDLGTRILQVNQSLLRRDADIFSETEIPMVNPAAPEVPPPLPPSSSSSSSARAPARSDTDEVVEDGSASYAHVLWQCQMKGKLDFLELFAGSARLSQCAALRGLSTGSPVDLRTGFDLNTRKAQARAIQAILEQKPEIIHMAPLCAPWCLLSNMKEEEAKAADRKAAIPMVRFCAMVALHQIRIHY